MLSPGFEHGLRFQHFQHEDKRRNGTHLSFQDVKNWCAAQILEHRDLVILKPMGHPDLQVMR